MKNINISCRSLGNFSCLMASVVLRGDFLQNRVLGAQNQSDARMAGMCNCRMNGRNNMAGGFYIVWVLHFVFLALQKLEFYTIFSNNVNILWEWCAKFINEMNSTVIKELQAMLCTSQEFGRSLLSQKHGRCS